MTTQHRARLQDRIQSLRIRQKKRRRNLKVDGLEPKEGLLSLTQSQLDRWHIDRSDELPQPRLEEAVNLISRYLPNSSQNVQEVDNRQLNDYSADVKHKRPVLSNDDVVSHGSSRVF